MGGRGSGSGFAECSRKIKKIEKSICNHKTETAYVFDDKGNTVFSKSDGSKSQVLFSREQVELMQNKILAHNHPSGRTFSVEDIKFFTYSQLEEIRATTKKGTFRLLKLSENESSGNMAVDYKAATEKFKEQSTDKEFNQIHSLYKTNQISYEEFEMECDRLNMEVDAFNQNWLECQAFSYGCKYKFERWD